MHAAIAVPGSASTILTHVFGRGLADERYVVERYRAMADGDIRRAPGDAAPAKGRRKAKRTVVSLKAVHSCGPPAPRSSSAPACASRAGCRSGATSRRGFSATASRSADRRSPRTSCRPPAATRRRGVLRPESTSGKEDAMAYRDPEVRRARDRERFQRRTAERIARGLCPKCGERPPEPERSLCAPCAEKRNRACRARDAKLRAAGKPRRDPAKARSAAAEPSPAGRRAPRPGAVPELREASASRPAAACANPCGEKRRGRAQPLREGKAAGKPYGGRDPGQRRKMAREKSRRRLRERLEAACAPDAGTGPRPRTARPASRAVKPARPPSANSMPRGASPVSAPVAGSGPSTAALPAHHAPCARAGAIRRRRTQPPDGSTPGGGPRGNAPTAESPRRARRGASPVRSGPGSARNTSAGFRCGHRNTP